VAHKLPVGQHNFLDTSFIGTFEKVQVLKSVTWQRQGAEPVKGKFDCPSFQKISKPLTISERLTISMEDDPAPPTVPGKLLFIDGNIVTN
jgi:hypothetical protein